MRCTLRQLEYFVAVGETGAVVKAAEKLGISSPSVSAAVLRFEEDMGAPLFARKHARGLTLTPVGRRLLRKAKRLLADADDLVAVVAAEAGEVAGALSLGCLQTVAPYVLPSLRRGFERMHPRAQIRQSEDNQETLLRQLQNNDLDSCLTYDLELPDDIRFLTLTELPVYVMLPPAHRLAKRNAIAPEDLREENLILLDLPLSAKYFLSMFQMSGVKPKIVARVKDMALARSMVANNFGYGLGNLRPRADLAPDGKPLVFAPLKGGLRPVRLGLATLAEPSRAGIVNAFAAYCQESFANGEASRLMAR